MTVCRRSSSRHMHAPITGAGEALVFSLNVSGPASLDPSRRHASAIQNAPRASEGSPLCRYYLPT
nr:MAG TPA: hypothetical protein [Caudoviricetes sp.]